MLGSINAGLIGYGYASKTLHAPLINATEGIRLCAISSRDGAKVKADWPEVQHCATPEQLIALEELELIVIASPNDSHFPLAKAALEAGKHVVVDKPFTLTLAEAEALSELAKRKDKLLAVFHNRRWDADFLTLRRVIASGELGEIQQFESHIDRYRPVVRERWREQAQPGAGLWYDLGPHLLDQSLQLFGEPDSLYLDLATQRSGAQTDDHFHAVLSYGKQRVILHASTQVLDAGPRYQLMGSKGCYRKYGLDTQENQLKSGMSPLDSQFGVDPRPGVLLTAGSATAEQLQSGDVPVRRQSVANQRGDYLAFYRGMVEAIQHDAPLPVLTQDAVKVMQWLELGLQSANEGRRIGKAQASAAPGVAISTTAPAPQITPPTATLAAKPAVTPQPQRPMPRPLDPATRPSRASYGDNNPLPRRAATLPPRPTPASQPAAERQPLTSLLDRQAAATARPTQPGMLGQDAMRQAAQPQSRPVPPASVPAPDTRAAAQPRFVTRTGETGSIRVDKPRGQSISGKSSLPHQPASGELMPSASRSSEPPRTAPRSAGVPFTHFERPPAIQEKHQAEATAAQTSPLSPPKLSALDGQESSMPLILPELSPSSLIASEKQATRGRVLPHLSVEDEADDKDDDLPSFTAR